MKSWTEYCKAALSRHLLIPVAAAAMALSLTAYEFEKPVRAAAAAAEPAARRRDVRHGGCLGCWPEGRVAENR